MEIFQGEFFTPKMKCKGRINSKILTKKSYFFLNHLPKHQQYSILLLPTEAERILYRMH